MLVLDVPFCYVEALGDDGASAVASLGVLANPVGQILLAGVFQVGVTLRIDQHRESSPAF